MAPSPPPSVYTSSQERKEGDPITVYLPHERSYCLDRMRPSDLRAQHGTALRFAVVRLGGPEGYRQNQSRRDIHANHDKLMCSPEEATREDRRSMDLGGRVVHQPKRHSGKEPPGPSHAPNLSPRRQSSLMAW